MKHTARIFLAETTQRAQRAARIEWKDRFQMWWILFSNMKLFRAEAGNTDHTNVAVTPRLLCNPLDEVVAVPLPASAALGLENSTRRTNDVNIAARDKELGIARLQKSRP